MAKTNKKKSSKKQASKTPSEQLKEALVAGNTYEAIRLCGTHKFTQKQLEAALKAAFAKKQYQCIKEFQSHFAQKEDTSIEEVVTIYATHMAQKDKKYFDEIEKNDIKIDWYIYSKGYKNASFRTNSVSSDNIKYYLLTSGDDERNLVFKPFEEGNLLLAKAAVEYMTYQNLEEATRKAIKNGHFKLLEDLAVYLSVNGYDKASRIVATQLAVNDVDKYGKWSKRHGLSIEWDSASRGVYALRIRGKANGEKGVNNSEKLPQIYAAMWNENIANKPDFEDFKKALNTSDLTDFEWDKIIEDVHNHPERIDSFFKPLCQYLIETNQTSVLSKIFNTAVNKDFADCAVAAIDVETVSPATLMFCGYSSELLHLALDKGIDIYLCDEQGRSALSAFVLRLSEDLPELRGKRKKYYDKFIADATEKLELLLTSGVDVNHTDNDDKNVLDYLFTKPENFQDDIWITCINTVLNQDGLKIPLDSTPYLAIALDKMPTQTCLIKNLINRAPELIVQKDEKGRNALMIALEGGQYSLFQYMLEQSEKSGTEIILTPNDGVAMVLAAAAHSEVGIDCLQVLFSSGIDINQKDADGYTPLHRAIQKKDAIALENLLRFGADDQIKTPDGKSIDELITSVAFTKGAAVLNKARAARGKIKIADENDLLAFVSYATPEQFAEFQEKPFSDITNEMLVDAVNKAKRKDLLPYISANINMGKAGSEKSRRTLYEQTASSFGDGVTIITDSNSETQGIQGVVSEDYKLFESLIKSIEDFDLASFNVLLDQIPPENLLKYNSQGFNPIAVADEHLILLSGIAQKQIYAHSLTAKEQEIANLPDFKNKMKIIQSMREQLLNKAAVSLDDRRLDTPFLPANQKTDDIRLKKALKEGNVDDVCILIMDKKFLPSEENRSATVELLIQNKKHKELKTLFELAREEGKLADFIDPFRDGAGAKRDIWGEDLKYFDINTRGVVDNYAKMLYDYYSSNGKNDSNISYENLSKIYTSERSVSRSLDEEIYFLTIAKRVLPPKESDWGKYNRENVVKRFTEGDFVKKYPEALELFLKLAKDYGCYDEVLGYINPGDKSKPIVNAAIEAANAYVPAVNRIRKAANDQQIGELEDLILNGLEVPPAEDKERIVDSLKKKGMSTIVFETYNQNSEEDAVKTDIILPKNEDRYKVLALLIENKKYDAVKKLLSYAKEKGELKEFLYALPYYDKKVSPSSTPIELVLRSGDEKMKGILLSMVSDTDLDFLMDHKPYEQLLNDAVLNKNQRAVAHLIQSQQYLPPKYLRYNTMRLLIAQGNQQTIETFFDLMKNSKVNMEEFLNTPDENGVTLLMLAARSGSAKIYDLLLANGAKTEAVDNKGRGVYDYAKPALKPYLKQKGEQFQQQRDLTVSLDMFSQNITQEQVGENLPKSLKGRGMS